MRICRVIETKRIIGMQSDATPGTLIANAFSEFGLLPFQIEELEVDQAGYLAALEEDPIVIAANAAEDAVKSKENRILQEVIDNLPTWIQVTNAIDVATTVPQLKVIIKKLARVVYLLAKNEET